MHKKTQTVIAVLGFFYALPNSLLSSRLALRPYLHLKH